MIKVVSLFRRRPGLAVDEFQRYWRGPHAGIARELPGLRRYVQSHTLTSAYARLTPVCDGMAELWFDDSAALRALAATPAHARALADRAAFIDPDSYVEILTTDILVKDAPLTAGGVKSIELVKRRPDLEPEPFHAYWQHTHGALGAAIPQVRRYVQSHTRAGAYRDGAEPPLDGVAITWFDDTAAMRAAARTEEYARTRADEANFVDAPLDFFITREQVIVG